ncbi:MAG: NAD(P)/FAD-dependent oxidoreductase [Bryobacterales bacterium]
MDLPAYPNKPPRVVIIGGGFGGLNVARALHGDEADVVVIDRRNYHLFQPLLYQVATAGLSPGDIAYPIRAVLSKYRMTRTLLADVVAIDPDRKKVLLHDDELDYDYLVLATGAKYSYFGKDDWEKIAPPLKRLEDALEIRRRILLAFEKAERESDSAKRQALLTFVVVGGGPTGVELAGAIAEIARKVMVDDFRSIDPRDARIILVEAGPTILSQFPKNLAVKAESELKRIGCWVWDNTKVTAVERDHVMLDGERRIDTCTVLWAAGVKASGLGRDLGAELDRIGRVIVNPDLTVPGHPEIFVIGDLANCKGEDGQPLPGLAPVAMQQGRSAGANILRSIRKQPLEAFKYLDKGTMATVGRAAAIAKIGKVQLTGLVAWLAWLFVHIMYLVGFRNRVIVLINWAWAYFRMQRGARLIYGDVEHLFPPVGPHETVGPEGEAVQAIERRTDS